MATWVGVIVETQDRGDFWDVAAKLDVRPTAGGSVPRYALVDCDLGFDLRASLHLAERLSLELATTALGFLVATSADVHELHAFSRGRCLRTLGYNRDGGGWVRVEGEPQPWERAYFFDGGSTGSDGHAWPDLLSDELSAEDEARYEAAKSTGDASPVLGLLHPSSTAPMRRVCESFGISAEQPAGRWSKPTLVSRLFGRRR